VWLWYFLLDKNYRGSGLGSKIIKSVQDYFSQGFGICDFYTGLCDKDTRLIKFWTKAGFKLIRVSKGFFNVNEREEDMLILKNHIYE
jgi:GNAT superfamily N-acetyltransferase